MNKKLEEIKQSIKDNNVSYEELAWLHGHKQLVLDTGDAELCEWAGISESEYNAGKLADLPDEVDLSDMKLPQEFDDFVWEKLCEIGGEFYPKAYGLDIKIKAVSIDWESEAVALGKDWKKK